MVVRVCQSVCLLRVGLGPLRGGGVGREWGQGRGVTVVLVHQGAWLAVWNHHAGEA